MEMTIASLSHHPGLHVEVDLQGKTVGGVPCEAEQWVPGGSSGAGSRGNYLTIKLDTPIGAEPGRGLLHRGSKGQDMVSVDEVVRLRLLESRATGGRARGHRRARSRRKTLEAIKRYRALNGASLDEARAALRNL